MKIFNILALASFGVSISIVGGTIAGYFYLKNPSTQQYLQNKLIKAITPALTEGVTGALPKVDIPALPNKTGGVVPLNL
tara:strand:- start:162 stop:398 length:237 start_codon:yes stop_codon:yes gene_type:complete